MVESQHQCFGMGLEPIWRVNASVNGYWYMYKLDDNSRYSAVFRMRALFYPKWNPFYS